MTAGAARRADQSADDIAYLTALVRDRDRPRYYATLLAPSAIRPDLFALYGLAAEIARIPDQVREPGLGEIRLQWWRDALHAVVSHDGAGENPALRAIGEMLRRHALPEAPLAALVEARSADLYSDPPASIVALEGYLGETESVLFQMAAIICGAAGPKTAEAAGHAGIAYGLARRLSVLASDHARGRTIIPQELLPPGSEEMRSVFAASAADLERPIAALVTLARDHLRAAQEHGARLSKEKQLAFLPIAVVRPLLGRVGRRDSGVTAEASHITSLTRIVVSRLRGIRG